MLRRQSTGKFTLLLFHLGAILTVTAWGASFVSTKVLLDNGLHPAEIYVYRFTLAYLIVLLFNHEKFRSNSLRDEGLFLLIGLCAGSIYFIAENTALQYTLTTNVSLITTTAPILTTLLVGAIYKSERPGRGFLVGSGVAFLGVGFVVFNSSFMIQVNPLGDLLSLLAAFAWAVYSLLLRKLNATYSVMYITRKTFFYGVITAIPFVLIEPEISSPALLLRPAVIGNLVFLGIFASMVGYALWAQTVKALGPVKASNYLYFQPIVTLIIAALALDEHVSWIGYTGCALIIGGVWLSDFLTRRSLAAKS